MRVQTTNSRISFRPFTVSALVCVNYEESLALVSGPLSITRSIVVVLLVLVVLCIIIE